MNPPKPPENDLPSEAPLQSRYSAALHVNTADAIQHSPHARSPGANSPMSTPMTPNLKSPHSRRTSQPAVSPVRHAASPRPQSVQRSSSSASMHRQSSSPNPKLTRKSSRSSLGGASEDADRRPTPKRSISNLIAGLREAHSTMEAIEEPIPLTAVQIATEHFVRELLSHTQQEVESDTVVILHDACYGHRFSRLKATKTTLSMIVERPERIHASVLGASAAYVRLGGHHAGAENAPHPDRAQVASPAFKIRRSGRVLDIMSSFVTNVHGTAWMAELRGLCNTASEKLAVGAKELARNAAAGEHEQKKLHEGDLYLAPQSLDAFQGAMGGVADAVDAVFGASKTSRAFVAVRPPGHHCSADYPSGFCWVNNVHVGIEYAAQTYGLTHAAIIDFDLHHGDGSQAITWERNSKNNIKRLNAKPTSKLKLGPDIGYYSVHDINSYPCEMGDEEKVQAASLCIENAHGQSIWNVHLQPWKTEADFWRLYEDRYSVLLEKARTFLQQNTARIRGENKVEPKAAIFISAGFDASEWEGSGMQRHKVNVPTEFYARFTDDIVKLSQEASNACDGRVISVLEGGYSDRALCSGVLSHISGLCTAPATHNADSMEPLRGLSNKLGGMSLSGLNAVAEDAARYNRDWWSASNLTALENKVNPPPPAQAKKVRSGPQPTYATPTESFAYKVIDTNKFARSISGTMREAPRPVRAPTPPPPEVDWVVATQELSKLLIPTDRQTKSCTPEELAGPRIKKERESTAPAIDPRDVAQSRQLRDRRGKAPGPTESVHSDETETVRSVSRSSRRETIDVLPSEQSQPAVPRRASRRLSAGSTLSYSSPDIDPQAPPVPLIPKSNGQMKPPPRPQSTLEIKKARAPVKPRTADVPSLKAPTSNGIGAKPSPPLTAPSSNSGSHTTTTAPDIDNLTTGMKKVTLKVSSSREEHDRKQKEKLDAERRARALKGAETRRVNAAAKKAAVARDSSIPAPVPALAPQVSPHVEDAGSSIDSAFAPAQTVAPASSLVAAHIVPTNDLPSVDQESVANNAAIGPRPAFDSTAPSATVQGIADASALPHNETATAGQSFPVTALRPHSLEFPAYAITPFESQGQTAVTPSELHAMPSMMQPSPSYVVRPPPMYQHPVPPHSQAANVTPSGLPMYQHHVPPQSQAASVTPSSLPIYQHPAPLQPQAANAAAFGPLAAQGLKTSPRGSALPVWSSTGSIPFGNLPEVGPNADVHAPTSASSNIDSRAADSMHADPLGPHFARTPDTQGNGPLSES